MDMEGAEENFMSAKPEESVYNDGGSWLRGRLLGEGSYGMVHLAHFPNPSLSPRFKGFPSLVAVKSAVRSSPLVNDLVEEKAIYELLGQSPFVIRCFGEDVTVAENRISLLNVFLEYASGGTLHDLIEKSEGLGLLESQAREFTRSILGGIKHIHEAGFVHCDLKPDNVLLVEDGGRGLVAKIGDFGLAKRVIDEVEYIQGTEMYLAPECLEEEIQGQPSDIWALGCVVLSMLTGRLEWEGDQPSIEGNFSKEAEDFVRKCLSRRPSHRPTATALLSHPFVSGSAMAREGHSDARDESIIYRTLYNLFKRACT